MSKDSKRRNTKPSAKKVRSFIVTFFFSNIILFVIFSIAAIAKVISPAGEASSPENITMATKFFDLICSIFSTKNYVLVTSIIGNFALLASLTANKVDNKVCDFLLKIINLFGSNFGMAANKETPKNITPV